MLLVATCRSEELCHGVRSRPRRGAVMAKIFSSYTDTEHAYMLI
jgi:hypothetical protein